MCPPRPACVPREPLTRPRRGHFATQIDEALRHDFLKPVWRAEEEVTRKHMINFNLIKPGEDVRQLVYKEVMRYNSDPATRTCEVPFKGVLDPRAGAVKPATPSHTGPAGAGAGAGAGGGAGSAGSQPGSATSTESLNARMSSTDLSAHEAGDAADGDDVMGPDGTPVDHD